MEVFDFMPYTYYTRMTAGGGKNVTLEAVKKWKSFLHSPFSMASFSVNDSQLLAGIVISSG